MLDYKHDDEQGDYIMGYRILNITPEFRAQFEEREGLEGPFFYDGNQVLYYCPKRGRYYDPLTDLFITYNEYRDIAG
jgi:hypothetical protein